MICSKYFWRASFGLPLDIPGLVNEGDDSDMGEASY